MDSVRHYIRIILITIFFLSGATVVRSQTEVFDAKPIPAFDADFRVEGPSVSFIVLGDFGSGLALQRKVANGLFKKYTVDPFTAVLTTGDNIQPDGVGSESDPMWDIRFESVYPVSELPVPFYATLGNHDYSKNPDAQIRYKGNPLPDGSPHWRMPGRYWTHVFATSDGSVTVRVTGIDTHMLVSGEKADKKDQLAWLDSVLATANETWNVVIGHHPVYSNGQNGNTLSMIMQAKPVFEKHNIDAYFAGHDQNMQLLEPVNGVQYIVNGAGGTSRSVWWRDNTQFTTADPGFVWVQYSSRTMLIQFLGADALPLYAFTVTKD